MMIMHNNNNNSRSINDLFSLITFIPFSCFIIIINNFRSPNLAFDVFEKNTGVLNILIEFEKQQLKERTLFRSLIYTILKKTQIYGLVESAKKLDQVWVSDIIIIIIILLLLLLH